MPFEKGNKWGKGGRRDMKGKVHPMSKARREASSLVDRLAFDMAREHLENAFMPIMNAYIGLATGGKAGRKPSRLDAATCRHAVERALGQAPRTVTLDMQDTIESFFDKVIKRDEVGDAIDVTEEEDNDESKD